MTGMVIKIFAAGVVICAGMYAHDLHAQVEERLGTPNLLTGKTGVAGPGSVDSASINPAQAGAMRYTEIQGAWGFKSEEYLQRYPGFDPHQSSTSGLDGFPIPGFVYKVNSRLGIGGFAVPFPVKTDIDARRLPIILLGQENYVDLKGTGQLDALAIGTVGYAISNDIHLGANISYAAISGSVDLLSSEGQATLANIDTKASFLTIKLGTKVRANKFLTFGLVVGAIESTSSTLSAETALQLEEDETAAGPTNDTSSNSTFGNPIRAGLAVQPNQKLLLMADVEYRRVAKDQQGFSMSDFVMKQREVADTVSVYGGAEVSIGRGALLLGGLYEPSEIGQGSSGEDGLSGFGFMDIAQNLGEPPSRPQWMIGGGYRWEFGELQRRERKRDTKSDKKVEAKSNDAKMLFEAGVMYGETSIGVDPDGEQPGAYLVKRYKIPFKFTYRL